MTETIVTHSDSCVSYALRRVGLSHLINMDIETLALRDIYTSGDFQLLDYPEKGCLLIWVHKDENATHGYWQPHGIKEDGRIFYLKRFDYGHVAVFEGDNMISDLSRKDDKRTIIRLRRYEDVGKPDYILKWIGK